MSDKELWELMSIICEGQDSEQRRKVEQYITDLQKEIERLNNIIKRLENEINGAYSDLSNNLNVNYMHEALKKDLLEILGSDKE